MTLAKEITLYFKFKMYFFGLIFFTCILVSPPRPTFANNACSALGQIFSQLPEPLNKQGQGCVGNCWAHSLKAVLSSELEISTRFLYFAHLLGEAQRIINHIQSESPYQYFKSPPSHEVIQNLQDQGITALYLE